MRVVKHWTRLPGKAIAPPGDTPLDTAQYPGLDDPALSTEVAWTISIGACPPQPFCDSAMSRCAEWRIYDARTREAVQTQSQDATAQCYCKAPVAKSLEQLGAR